MTNTNKTNGIITTPEAPINEKQVGVSKKAIAAAYQGQIKEIVEKANNVIKLKDEDTKTLEDKIKQFETEGGKAGDLRAAIELLAEIADKKDKSIEELKVIEETITTAKAELKSLEFFKDSAFDLVALTNTKNIIIETLDGEIKEIEAAKKEILKKRSEEEKEILSNRKVEEVEYNKALSTTRSREKEEYEYNFSIEKRTRTNELEEELFVLEDEAADKAKTIIKDAKVSAEKVRDEVNLYAKETRITIEDELREHKRNVKEFESKVTSYEELEKKVEEFDTKLKVTVADAVKSAEGRTKGIFESKLNSQKEISEMSLEAKNTTITSLKEALEKAEAAVTKAEDKADKAIEKMAEIANARSAASTPQVIVSEQK